MCQGDVVTCYRNFVYTKRYQKGRTEIQKNETLEKEMWD